MLYFIFFCESVLCNSIQCRQNKRKMYYDAKRPRKGWRSITRSGNVAANSIRFQQKPKESRDDANLKCCKTFKKASSPHREAGVETLHVINSYEISHSHFDTIFSKLQTKILLRNFS